MDTIFALASARGKAGVSVIRVSGPNAFEIARKLSGAVPQHRQSSLRKIKDYGGAVIDEALILGFEAEKSFTGEQVVEFHVHGSQAITARLLKLLGEFGRTRLAEPGEFTRRALQNDRLDLAQVEGLSDLIDAETEAQRQQAMRVFSGSLGSLVEGWRRDLIRARALLEATIDFADEDVPVDVRPEVGVLIADVSADLEREAAGAVFAERVREGFEVALVGPPNVGKSTLLNALAGRDAAITSEIEGTTRDIIEVRMDLGGLPVTILDTAGLRETSDVVESMGIQRTRDRAADADLRVFLKPSADHQPDLKMQTGDIELITKADVNKGGDISALSGQGIDRLTKQISDVLASRSAQSSVATRERHRVAIIQALEALKFAQEELDQGLERSEIAAEELRSATRLLESLVGRVDVEALLDEIFSSFCVGK